LGVKGTQAALQTFFKRPWRNCGILKALLGWSLVEVSGTFRVKVIIIDPKGTPKSESN
jgi:hypothetical protein